jgi:hypothetical protein
MLHDPTIVTDGIELSPEDQIIAVRRGAYLVSVAERTGGWWREQSSQRFRRRPRRKKTMATVACDEMSIRSGDRHLGR